MKNLLRVLVVEDDDHLRIILGKVIKSEGVVVELAGDGEAGWEALSSNKFDVLVTDVEMPGLNGLELVAKARSAGLHLPVIFLSAAAHVEQTVPWLGLGSVTWVRKPCPADELRNRLQEALQVARAKQSG